MYGQLVREMSENVDKNKTWQWLSKCDLKIGTEALLCAAQEQAKRTNYVKHYIDKTSESRGKRKGKSEKIPGLEERDRKIVKTQNGRSRTCRERSPWRCHQMI